MRLSDDNSELIRVGSGLEGILNHAGLVCRAKATGSELLTLVSRNLSPTVSRVE
jgi:hypothetical protein